MTSRSSRSTGQIFATFQVWSWRPGRIPREAGLRLQRSLLAHAKGRDECLLRNLHVAVLAHALLALLLLLKQLLLARDVAAVALCGHVLAQRTDRFASD